MMMCLSHLVLTTPALLNQDSDHLTLVVLGSQVNWKSTTLLRQQWVCPCLKECYDRGEVAFLAGHVERCAS